MAHDKKHQYVKSKRPTNYDQKPGESLEHYYRRLAKQADQRLVRLRDLSRTETYKNVTKFAYARAMKDIKQWSGEGATRFNTKPPENNRAIMAKIRDMRTFLEAPTSTLSGINAVYKKRADTINEKYGTNFKWQDLAAYFDDASASKTDSAYGSDTMLKAVAEIQKQSDTIIEQIRKHQKKHIVVDSPRLQDVVDSVLADRNLKITQFF